MDARPRELERVEEEDGVFEPREWPLRRGTDTCGIELEAGGCWDWACVEEGFARHCS